MRKLGDVRLWIKRLVYAIIGLALFATVFWLGVHATNDPRYVVWLGIAAAILVPLAFKSIARAIRPDEAEVLAALSRVTEIKEMMARASSEEERIRILEAERQRLEDTIRLEARHQALLHARSELESELQRKMTDYDAVIDELDAVTGEIEESPVHEEMARIRARLAARRKGHPITIRVGRREFVRSTGDFGNDNFGLLALAIWQLIERLQQKNLPRTEQPKTNELGTDVSP